MEELEKSIKELRVAIEKLNSRLDSWWRLFINGMIKGIGATVGVAIIVTLVGWILNIVGVIPFLGDFARDLKSAVEELRPN